MASDANRRAKRNSILLLSATTLRKFNSRILTSKRVLDLTCIVKGRGLKGVSNLIRSNGFRILAIVLFQVVVETCKVDSNGVKMVIFYKKLQKSPSY